MGEEVDEGDIDQCMILSLPCHICLTQLRFYSS